MVHQSEEELSTVGEQANSNKNGVDKAIKASL
jgi:hypothetical protein